jgi:murein DD-endopeptidase MepM/ murein hydrolase activator NlpD
VKRGETLYRIARTYGIDARDLMEVNDVADPRSLMPGAELFVPGARRPLEVPPLAGAAEPEEEPPPRPRPPAPGAAPPVPAERPSALRWPVKGVLYSRFGPRQGHRHDGIDIAAPEGSPVTAAADGLVVYAGEQAGYGHIVILRHGGGMLTLYAHASALLVGDGARVRAGEAIARVGQSGRTTGPHLHFEVRQGTRPQNPLLYLKR